MVQGGWGVVVRRLHLGVCSTHYLCHSHFQGYSICPPYTMPNSQQPTDRPDATCLGAWVSPHPVHALENNRMAG